MDNDGGTSAGCGWLDGMSTSRSGRHALRPVDVPGYQIHRLLGFGGSGEVWSATDRASGQRVALKLLRVSTADREAVLREAALMRRIDHPHVVRLRSVVDVPEQGLVLVLDHADGGSLASLVAARGRLDAGEVVTILTPLARALADLHRRGLVHADVSPGNVLFDGEGRPLLGDLGIARVLGTHGSTTSGTDGFVDPCVLDGLPVSQGSDVYGLGAVGWFALTGRPPGPVGQRPPLVVLVPGVPAELVDLVERTVRANPDGRPGADRLAVECFESAPAAPVRLVGATAEGAAVEGEDADPMYAPVTHRIRVQARQDAQPSPQPDRWSRWRWVVAGATALAAVVVAVAVAAWVTMGGGGGDADRGERISAPADPVGAQLAEPARSAEPAPRDEPVPPAESAQSVDQELTTQTLVDLVESLAERRARAFFTRNGAALESVNVPGSAAMEADLDRVRTLEDEGLRLADLSFIVERVREVVPDQDVRPSAARRQIQLEVQVVTSAHRQVRDDGSVAAEVPRGPTRTSVLTLARQDGRWRIVAVT